jgi:hypothetical protein
MRASFVFALHTLSIIILIPVFTPAQELTLPELKNYKQVKIGLMNYKRMEGKSLVILDDSVLFVDLLTQKSTTVGFEDINYLRVQKGTQAGSWALYGGLLMGLSCLMGVAEIESDPNMGYKENAEAVVVGFILGGAAVGALIGSAFPKWKTYYIHNRVGYKIPVNYDLYATGKQFGVSVRLNF